MRTHGHDAVDVRTGPKHIECKKDAVDVSVVWVRGMPDSENGFAHLLTDEKKRAPPGKLAVAMPSKTHLYGYGCGNVGWEAVFQPSLPHNLRKIRVISSVDLCMDVSVPTLRFLVAAIVTYNESLVVSCSRSVGNCDSNPTCSWKLATVAAHIVTIIECTHRDSLADSRYKWRQASQPGHRDRRHMLKIGKSRVQQWWVPISPEL